MAHNPFTPPSPKAIYGGGHTCRKLWFLDSLNRPECPGGFVIRPQKL